MRLLKLLPLAGLLLALTACGGGGGSNTGGGQTPSEDKIFDISGIKGEVILDEDGKPLFEEEINLKMWSIIGDPDRVVFAKMVDKFNEKYLGQIHIDVIYQGHYDFYNALDATHQTDFEKGFPDITLMHNEKTIEYAYKDYLYPLDELYEKTGVSFDFTQVYENQDRVTKYKNHRFGIPVDAHGFLTQFRQDIIKKNNLGFDNNTRFIPEGRDEYQELLEKARALADSGELLIRNINKGADHSWKKANKNIFFPSFTQSTDPDGLSALYANGGRLTNDDQTKVTFQENKGYQTYLTDQVLRANANLVGESGTNIEMFGNGNTLMFTEGPWWVSQTFSLNWNNQELRKAGNGVTAEEAKDPVYSMPYTASRPLGWWTLDENKDTESGSKWYGNGHVINLTKHITDMNKAAAALTFAEWFTQGIDEDGNYNLITWNQSGHLPAWKNVYKTDTYKAAAAKNMTLRALGDPNDIIAMEGLEYESTLFTGIANSCGDVQAAIKQGGCTVDKAIKIINDTAESTQASLDLLKMGF